VADTVYDNFKWFIADGTIVWPTSDIHVLLLATTVAGAFAPALVHVSDLLAVTGVAEVTGGGYTRLALAGRAVVQNPGLNRAEYQASNPSWAAASWTNTVALVVYLEGGGTDATRVLISYHDSGFPKAPNGGAFTPVWPGGRVIAGI
jgi:hypothetical protein